MLTREHDVLARYHEALASLREAYARSAPAAELKETVARIESLKQDYAQIETDIRDASPIYRNLLGAKRQAQTWDEIAAPILAPGNALVLYYLGHAESHLFVIDGRSRSIEYFPLDVPDNLADRIGFPPGAVDAWRGWRNWWPPTWKCCATRIGPPQRGLSKKTVESKKGQADLAGHALSIDEQLALAEIVLPAAAREHIAKLDAAKRDRRARRGARSTAARIAAAGRPSRRGICSTSFRPSPTLRRQRSWRCWSSGGPAPAAARRRC